MEYHGKLYGKIGNRHFDTGKTSDDFDQLEKQRNDLLEALQEIVSHVRLDLLPRTTANKITQAIEKALK